MSGLTDSATEKGQTRSENAVNAAMARNLASYDKKEWSGDDFTAPVELRKRSVTMQKAINAAMFGSSHALDRGLLADRMFQEAHEEEHNTTTARVTALLHSKLLRQADTEAKLIKESLETSTSEEVLQQKCVEEENLVRVKAKQLKVAQGESQRLQLQSATRLVKIKSGEKSIMLLEMKVKDLNREMAEINNKEHITTGKNRETNNRVRRLEREMYDLKSDNEKLNDSIQRQIQKRDALFQKQERVEDELLRAKQRAEMQAIALDHELAPLKLRHEDIKIKYEDTKEEHDGLVLELQNFQELHAEQKVELKQRINDEQAANETLVKKLAAASMKLRDVSADLSEEEAAKAVIMTQLADKDGLCLQMGKRLYKVERSFLEITTALKERDEQTNELEQLCETMKSTSQILNGKLKKEQSATRKLMKWTQMERLTAEELDHKLTALQNNEVTNELTLGEEGALKSRLNEMLREAGEEASKTKQRLHEATAKKDLMDEELQDLTAAVVHMQKRLNKEAAGVEKLNRELNQRTRTFESKHKQLMLTKGTFEGKVAEVQDELGRLNPEMDKSMGEVKALEEMIETRGRKSEKERQQFAKELGDLDLENTKLSAELRQQCQRNEIMETNNKMANIRVKEISAKMLQNEEVAAEQGSLNSEEELLLETRLRNEVEKANSLAKKLADNEAKLFSLQARLEAEDHSLRHAVRDMRLSRTDEDQIVHALEDSKETTLDITKRLQNLEQERDRLQVRVDDKTDEMEKCRDLLKATADQVDVLRKEIHDAEVKESDLFSAEKIDQARIHVLKNEYEMQDEQHNMDANMVKLKIVQLQDALKEKMATVTKLENLNATTREHVRALELRQQQSATEEAQVRKTFEKMLDDERRKVAALRNGLETQSRDNVTLRQSDLSVEEALQSLEGKLGKTLSDNEGLLSAAYRKGRQMNSDAIAVSRLTQKDRELLEQNLDLQEELEMLRFDSRENENVERDLNRELRELQNENKAYKMRVLEKMKAERRLLLQVEATRAGVHNSTGHGLAEQHAEEAMEELLHKEIDSDLQ